MNKNTKLYGALIIFIKSLHYILKPIYRMNEGLKRASLFGKIGIYSESDISTDLVVKYPNNLFIGKGVRIGPGCKIGAASKVFLGDEVTISEGVTIETAGLNTRLSERVHTSKEISIDEGAWIGTRAIILGGAKIGSKSIIAAGSIVKGLVPPNHIYSNGALKRIEKR